MPFELSPEEKESVSILTEEGGPVIRPATDLESLEKLSEGDPDLKELLDSMVKKCLDYTVTVARYTRALQNATEKGIDDEMREIDKIRKVVHEATIDSINIFSRALLKSGKDNSWMKEVSENRAAYGKFALGISLSRI